MSGAGCGCGTKCQTCDKMDEIRSLRPVVVESEEKIIVEKDGVAAKTASLYASEAERSSRFAFLNVCKKENDFKEKIQIILENYKKSSDDSSRRKESSGWMEYGFTYFPPETPGCTLPDCPSGMRWKEFPADDINDGFAYSTIGKNYSFKHNSNEIFYDGNKIIQTQQSTSYLQNIFSMYSNCAWGAAPEQLKALWPEFVDYFDDKSCVWMYMAVSHHTDVEAGFCIPHNNLSEQDPVLKTEQNPAFLVSGIMPYLLYDIKELSLQKTCTGDKVSIIIRYFAGMINHFSFFASYEDKESYLISDLPADVFDANSQTVSLIGNRVDYWLRLSQGLIVSIELPFTNKTQYYPCNPQNIRQDPDLVWNLGLKYAFSDVDILNNPTLDSIAGDPTPFCFSDQVVTDEEMRSLLGVSAVAEMCFVVEPEELRDLEGLIMAGCVKLFGNKIILNQQVSYFPSPIFEQNFVTSAEKLSARIVVDARSLKPFSDIYRKISALRQTPQGKWLFRTADIDRIVSIANIESEESCCS